MSEITTLELDLAKNEPACHLSGIPVSATRNRSLFPFGCKHPSVTQASRERTSTILTGYRSSHCSTLLGTALQHKQFQNSRRHQSLFRQRALSAVC